MSTAQSTFAKALRAVSPEEAFPDWSDPKPLEELVPNLPPWPKDLALVPPPLEDLARALGARLAVDPTPAILAGLTVLSGVLANRGVVVRPDPYNAAHVEAPVLWTVLIGPPGSGKTPILSTMARPVREIEARLAQANREALEEYEAELDRWEAQKRGERGPRPKPPPKARLLVGDATPEALAAILAENYGVLAVVDELKGLLASWQKEGREDARAFYLSAYSGEGQPVDRIGRGMTYLYRPMVALLGGIQTGPWYRVFKEAQGLSSGADGLLQRFTPVMVVAGPPERDPPPLPQRLLEEYTHLVEKAWEVEEGLEVSLGDKDALKLWREWEYENRLEARKEGYPESWQSYLAKRAGLTIRLAAILALASGRKAILQEDLGRAILLAQEVLEPHARAAWRVARDAKGPLAQRLARTLLAKGVERFTLREVYTREWAGITTSEEARDALFLLERAGWVRYDPPTRTWEVNPKARRCSHAS